MQVSDYMSDELIKYINIKEGSRLLEPLYRQRCGEAFGKLKINNIFNVRLKDFVEQDYYVISQNISWRVLE